MILESPVVASILGVLFGVLLIGAYGFVAIKFTGEKAKTGMYLAMGLSFAELFIALGVLLLYRAVAKPGVIWFGGAMAVGFIIGFVALIAKLAPQVKK